jgi:hypothetical protein
LLDEISPRMIRQKRQSFIAGSALLKCERRG